MNRAKRDYCSIGIHPAWKAWVAKYDMSCLPWTYVGNFCEICGARLSNGKTAVSNKHPDDVIKGKLFVFGKEDVSYLDVIAYKEGRNNFLHERNIMRLQIRRRLYEIQNNSRI